MSSSRDKPVEDLAENAGPRSKATRQQLIDAAIDLFGRRGYDATSTRALTDAANVNLGAIPYHFGTKQKLRLAAAQFIADSIARTVGPVMDTFEHEIFDRSLARSRAIALLQEIFTPFVAMLTSEQSDRWAQFILREQAEPSEAFEILYKHGSGRFVRAVSHLTAIAAGDEPGSRRAKVRALSLIGQVFIFRSARALVLRLLETDRIKPEDAGIISALIRENIRLYENI